VNSLSPMIALACVLLGSPSEPPSASTRVGADVHASVTQRLSFDESIGASGSAPIVVGLEQAAADKRERDRAIPRLSQNPQITVMPGARVNAGPDDGLEVQTTIVQGWSLEGYGVRRRAAAAAETEVIDADARARALERRFGAAEAWIRLHSAQLRLDMAHADLELAEQLVATLEQAREAGVATRSDVAEARAIAVTLEAEIVELGGEVHDLGLLLAREIGVAATAPLGTRGDYPDPQLPEEAELRRRFAEIEQLPAVALRRVQARAAQARVHEADRSRGAVLNTGASVQLESTNEVLVFGVIGASVPIADRNQRQRASARAQARQAEAEAEQIAVELTAVLAAALHELRHTQKRVELLREQTLPALDELVAARATALELGEGTRARLLEAQHRRNLSARELVTAEAEWVRARVVVWLYLEALERQEDA
jgi:outer membrane protein, heavy metal efflux system